VRIKALLSLMEENGIDYVIFGPTSNMFYLTGFSEEQMERPLLLIVGKGEAYFLASKIYEEQLSSLGFPVFPYNDGEDPYSKLKIEKGSSIAVDDQLWSKFTVEIANTFLPRKLLSSSTLMSTLRVRKDENEVSIMKEGLRIAEDSFLSFLNRVEEEAEECMLAKRLEEEFYLRGVEPSFRPIVTSGPNASMPHLRCTQRKVKRGEVMVVDFGVKYRGYSTDTTRVISIGNPSQEVKMVYSLVLEAQEKAEEAIEGMKGKEIDNLARSIIKRNGFGSRFIHRTGHGIGIDVHENPYISQDSEETIERGMTFTVEPGIYLQGKFGVRIEDMVIMDSKARKMNTLEKDIFIV